MDCETLPVATHAKQKQGSDSRQLKPELSGSQPSTSQTTASQSSVTQPSKLQPSRSRVKRVSERWSKRLERYRQNLLPKARLTLIPAQDQQDYIASICQAQNGAPWLLFLHGNNQTFNDSVEVCRKLQRYYSVNIVLFSWPSRSYNPRSVPHVLASALMMAHPATRTIARLTAVKSLYDRHAQYRQARGLAQQTVPALAHALALLIPQLLSPANARGVACHLLVHSLGHYLLQLLAEQNAFACDFKFQTAIFHQADLEIDVLPKLVASTDFLTMDSLYVTHNRRDYALFLSGLWNNQLRPNRAYSRLGNGLNAAQNQPFKLIDFTGLAGVGMNHGILWQDALNPDVKAHIYSILHARL